MFHFSVQKGWDTSPWRFSKEKPIPLSSNKSIATVLLIGDIYLMLCMPVTNECCRIDYRCCFSLRASWKLWKESCRLASVSRRNEDWREWDVSFDSSRFVSVRERETFVIISLTLIWRVLRKGFFIVHFLKRILSKWSERSGSRGDESSSYYYSLFSSVTSFCSRSNWIFDLISIGIGSIKRSSLTVFSSQSDWNWFNTSAPVLNLLMCSVTHVWKEWQRDINRRHSEIASNIISVQRTG